MFYYFEQKSEHQELMSDQLLGAHIDVALSSRLLYMYTNSSNFVELNTNENRCIT